MDSIEDKLRERLAEKFGGSPQLTDGLAFLGVDSIGMAELTVELEKEFNIQIQDDIVDVETVQELADYIRARCAT